MSIKNSKEEAFQLKFVRAAHMLLFANASCYPPLGQMTVIPSSQDSVKFTVLIESSKSFPEQDWEAVLWHNGHEDREWQESALEELQNAFEPLAVNSASLPRVYRRYFSTALQKPADGGQVQFTLKFRLSSNDTWKWVNEHCGAQDGEICFQPKQASEDLGDFLQNYSPEFSIYSVESETPHTQLWSLTAKVTAAKEKASGFADTSLGTPRDFARWFSLVRIWTPWLAPEHGQGNFSPSQDAILACFLRKDGLHLVLLALSGVDEVLSVFRADGHGNVIVHSRNDSTREGDIRVIAAVGASCNSAIAAAMYHARKIVRGDDSMSTEVKEEMALALEKGVKAEWMENWYDGLTYCTWNALGQDLTEQKIFDALDILKEKNIKVTNLIIDDNWQSLDNPGEHQFIRGWTDFDANKEGFPRGLKHTTTKIRDDHPNIQHIAVWHAILGYWGGVSPTGNIAKHYKTREVRKANSRLVGGPITVVDEEDVPRMYDDFYRFLLQSGIDSVKTDAQFYLDLIDDADDRRRFMKTYQDAWTIASLRYFSIKAISCMSLIPQIIFHTQLPTDKPRLMVRNSDDFFPDIPSSHPFHIFTNAYTSLFTSHLNVLPDWDMFQTSHPYSSYHAAARCLSGGPIYITDTPGMHDISLIRSMTAQAPHPNSLQSFRTIILRPSTMAKTIEQNIYTAYHETLFLRVGGFHGASGTGTSFLGVFNVSETPLRELVHLSAFPGIGSNLEQEYIIQAFTTGEISDSISLSSSLPIINLALESKGWEILAAYPLLSSSSPGSSDLSSSPTMPPRKGTQVAVLGLLGKMTGAAALASAPSISEDPHNDGFVKIGIESKALGILGIWTSSLPVMDVGKDVMVTMQGRGVPEKFVKQKEAEKKVLEIDVEGAWMEMGLKQGWESTVGVEVWIRGS